MPSIPNRDPANVHDMLHFARQIVRFTSTLESSDGLAANEEKLAATLYAITVLGEAARRVSPDFRSRHTQVPWPKIAGIRNVIVHEYQRVDLKEIWNVCSRDVPALIPQLEDILKHYPV
jgi:uncharacterized protein with HEPN domain